MEHTSASREEEEEHDWEITADGLYMATRGLLLRRGYCCANQCRNCPYVNWRDNPTWHPAPHEYVHQTRVSPKAVTGAEALLIHHRQHLQEGTDAEREQHHAMVKHYSFLLAMWGESGSQENNIVGDY